tara:strand:- start:776 stop:904 length:129 start_codon:yes stop_codon:yes gene_type:complete
MKNKKVWEAPKLTELGKASELIQSVDVAGTGDASFPLNLQSA